MQALWADPTFLAKMEATRRRQWADPAYVARFRQGLEEKRDRQLAALAKLKDDPEFRRKQREAVQRWQGQHEIRCAQCSKLFIGGRLARRCPDCRAKSLAALHRVVAQLIVRDGPNCQVCSKVIDFALPSNDEMGPSVDHRISQANGGNSDMDNLQLAHRRCNSLKR